MTEPRHRVAKSKIGSNSGYAALVAGLAIDGQPRVELRIQTRGSREVFADFTPRQAQQLIRSLEAALSAAEELTRHDGICVASGARVAPAEDNPNGRDAVA